MIIFYQIIFLIITYLLAAIPFGLILTKTFAKKDVRESGSKNIGATNVVRVAGKKLGLATLLLDGVKGAIMVIAARFAFADVSHLHLFLSLVCVIAVIGHVYPIYLNFKGGKGVATTIAVLLALDPTIGLLVAGFWILSFCLFRTSSIASLTSTFSAIFLSLIYGAPISQAFLCAALFAIILIRHKENITRLLTGQEKPLK